MIEKEQRDVERRPITKITHKGEIEIESQEPMKAPEPVEVRKKQILVFFLLFTNLINQTRTCRLHEPFLILPIFSLSLYPK